LVGNEAGDIQLIRAVGKVANLAEKTEKNIDTTKTYTF
jgi:hypothetical protein